MTATREIKGKGRNETEIGEKRNESRLSPLLLDYEVVSTLFKWTGVEGLRNERKVYSPEVQGGPGGSPGAAWAAAGHAVERAKTGERQSCCVGSSLAKSVATPGRKKHLRITVFRQLGQVDDSTPLLLLKTDPGREFSELW